LVSWTRPDVWRYIQENDVPFNQLHLQDYPSISCYHCTKPVPGSTPEQEVREGRWAGKDKTECGLHYSI
jgi:phosphoadenosine phosphosulfate reductase